MQRLVKLLTGLLVFTSLLSLFITSHQQAEITASALAGAVFCCLVSFALSKAKLVTQVRTDGIYISFPPLQMNDTVCTWDSIDTLFIRTYNPLIEFGGWGIRIGPNGRAYSTSGTTGLQIHFMNGGKLLIGTQQPDALRKALEQVSRYNFFH